MKIVVGRHEGRAAVHEGKNAVEFEWAHGHGLRITYDEVRGAFLITAVPGMLTVAPRAGNTIIVNVEED